MLKRIPLMRPLALSSVLWALLSGQAGAEEPMLGNLGVPPEWKSWDRMTVTAPRFMSNTKTLQLPDFLMKLWAREIAENDQKFGMVQKWPISGNTGTAKPIPPIGRGRRFASRI
jgi:hypothetical protein